jgi:two-component system response regulator PilR (NtrC family)
MPAELDHPKVLVIDDEPDLRTLYEVSLVREGYVVHCAEGVEQAIAALKRERFDAVISDMRLQDGLGLDVLRYITQAQRSERCVVITAYGSAENAVEALKAGAFDYLTKPVDLKQFRSVLAQAVRSTQLSQAPTLQQPSAQSLVSLDASGPDPDSLEAIMTAPRKVLAAPALPVPASAKAKSLAVPAPASTVAFASEPAALLRMVGNSASMQAVRDRVQKVARSMAPVLVRGESGTGKELVAKAVHACSHRASGPFVAVNCGAIPEQLLEAEFFGARKGAYTGATQDREGYFQAANGGTLFLDEIGDLPLAMQAKLLRAIQERSVRALGGTQEEAVDTRIVSATHHDLAAQVAKGLFRQDLYYRLNVIEIALPALRERRSDIPLLAQALLARIAADAGLAPRTVSGTMLAALQRNDLLGNVRELENILHRALALSDGDELELEDHDMQFGCPESAPPELGAVPIDTPAMAPLPAGVPSDLQSHLDIQEKAILLQALTECGFNRTAAAARLGISLRQIRYRMVRLGIDAQITAQQGSQQDVEQA